MKQVLELLGFIALVQGVLGLLHEWVHWDVGLVRRVGFLDGHEIYASVALIVLAFALFAVAERERS
ncbi:hypothetical protein [Streptomyces sp. NPDC053367]|uniref:hypothetical protein n=1 Tax=Streptomyces sp. NPDC053367 TaxID=3365700 RepID=UPI0037CD96A6